MINLLIVEDEPLLRASVQSLLNWEKEGFSFIGAAANGREGLDFIDLHPETDMILLDILMPVMDGLAMMEELNKRENPPSVIILSANNQFSLVREAFQLGALDYVLKSEMDEISLLAQLNKAVEKIDLSGKVDRLEKRADTHLIINSLLEDYLNGKNGDMNKKLIDDLGFSVSFPCKMGLFHLDGEEEGEPARKIISLRAGELLNRRGGGSFHCLTENRALFFISPSEVDGFDQDFKEILKDTLNISIQIIYSALCESEDELPGEYAYLLSLGKGQSRIIRKAKSYIRKNYASPKLSLEEVSRYVEVSRTHFSAQFKKESAMTFRDYLTKVRIEAAKKLLEETNMRVYEISESVGYPNVEHFSRIFKKVTGFSPNRYHK